MAFGEPSTSQVRNNLREIRSNGSKVELEGHREGTITSQV